MWVPAYCSGCILVRLSLVISLLSASSAPLMSSGSAQFTVQPKSVEQAEGLEAVFECLYPGATDYTWEIDGQLFQGNFADGLRIEQPSFTNDAIKLIVPATAVYNSSIIKCLVAVRLPDGTYSFLNSTKTILIVHRIQVKTRHSSIISTTIPEVKFFANFYPKSNTSSERMCAQSYYINTTEFHFICDGYDVCDSWLVVIIPTEGARNGTPSEPVEIFFREAKGRSGHIHVATIDQARKIVTILVKVPNCTTFTSYRLDSDSLVTPVNGSIEQPSDDTVSITFSLPTDIMTEVTVTLTDVHGVDLVFENVSIMLEPITTLNPSMEPPSNSTPVSVQVVAIIITIVVVVSIILLLSVVVLLVVCRKHKKQKYMFISSFNTGTKVTTGRAAKPERYIGLVPRTPCNSAQPEDKFSGKSGDNPSPQHKTVDSAGTETISPTAVTEDPDAQPLSPPFDPESSTDQSLKRNSDASLLLSSDPETSPEEGRVVVNSEMREEDGDNLGPLVYETGVEETESKTDTLTVENQFSQPVAMSVSDITDILVASESNITKRLLSNRSKASRAKDNNLDTAEGNNLDPLMFSEQYKKTNTAVEPVQRCDETQDPVSAPEIEIQPVDANVITGGKATFTVMASGEGLTYQWFGPGGVALENTPNLKISGATSVILRILGVQSSDIGKYQVRATNAAGYVDSDKVSLTLDTCVTDSHPVGTSTQADETSTVFEN